MVIWLLAAAAFAQEDPLEREERLIADMDRHFAAAITLRDAAIQGDLPTVRAMAAQLAERLPLDELQTDLQEPLRNAALQAAAATDTASAAREVARMADACGSCHFRVQAALPPPAPPASHATEEGGVVPEMTRHQEAATGMWRGIVDPRGRGFVPAAELLASSTLAPSGLASDASPSPLVVELEVRVHDLAAEAARYEDRAERARVYGELLGTCSACHAALRDAAAPEEPVEEPATPTEEPAKPRKRRR